MKSALTAAPEGLPPRAPINFFDVTERQAAYEYLSKRSIPLVAHKDGRSAVEGTATLLRVGDDHYLTTVAHTLEAAVDADVSLLVPDRRGGFIPLPGPVEYIPEAADRCNADVGVGRIDDKTAKQLLRVYEPLLLNDIQAPAGPVHGIYAVCGYLGTEPNPSNPTAHLHLSPVYQGEVPAHLQAVTRPDIHFLLELPDEVCDQTGATFPTPSLKGLSGAPLWCMTPSGAVWDPSCLRVLGVQTGVLRGRWIRFTNWGAVAGALGNTYPSLRTPLEDAWNDHSIPWPARE